MSDKPAPIVVTKKPLKHYRNESLHLKDPVLSFRGVRLFVPEENKQEVKKEGCFAFLRCK